MTYASGNIGLRGLNRDLIVVAYQAIRDDIDIPGLGDFFEQVDKYFLGPPAAIHDMVPGIGKFYS